MRYYFDGKKISGSQANKEAYVKDIFRQLFQNTNIPATRTISIQNEIFETIWNNTRGLPQNLFGTRLKPDAKIYFVNILISDLTSDLYKFIKVK